jgi:hypothetical protein
VIAGGALRQEARKLRRVAVFAGPHVDAVAQEKLLEAAQNDEVDEDAQGAVEEDVDKVPAEVGGEGGGDSSEGKCAEGGSRCSTRDRGRAACWRMKTPRLTRDS